VRREEAMYTAQAIIITDTDNNQITAFHPGAMQNAHLIDMPARDRPAHRHHRARRPRGDVEARRQLSRAGVPFIFDPGQQLACMFQPRPAR
jgi:adenosine kinase